MFCNVMQVYGGPEPSLIFDRGGSQPSTVSAVGVIGGEIHQDLDCSSAHKN